MATQNYYVKTNGNNNLDGQSWTNAFQTISHAISSCSNGDTIFVGQGTFNSTSTYQIPYNKSLTIKGGYNINGVQDYSQKTILNGGSTYRILRASSTSGTGATPFINLDGFVFKNAISTGWSGAVAFDRASGYISNCEFINNASPNFGGGGVAIVNSSAKSAIINCKFLKNSGKNGGAIYLSSTVEVDIINCTIAYDTCDVVGKGGGIYNAGTVNLYNSIITGNMNGPDLEQLEGGGIFNLNYNIIQGGKPASGGTFNTINSNDIDARNIDPQFISVENNNLRFQDHNSPAVNSGNNYLLPLSAIRDVGNNPRISNAIVDLGCYEYFDKQIDGSGEINLYNNIIQGGDSAISNTIVINTTIDTKNIDPLFRNVAFGSFQLLVGSPAIDLGDNSLYLSSFPQKDLENNARINNTTIDLGCYEYNITAPYYIKTEIQPTELDSKFAIYPNPVYDRLFIALTTPVDMVRMVDLTGKSVLMKHVSSDEKIVELNVCNISKGIYILIVGGQTQKVIIK